MIQLKKIALILRIYALSISIFFLFRLILFVANISKQPDEMMFSDIIKAFFMGIRFDIVITGYIVFFPALIIFILDLFKLKSKIINNVIFYITFTLFAFSFAISASDIAYFAQFFSRFSVTAFEWFDSPVFVFKMIIQEPKYIFPIIPFVIVTVVFFKILKIIFKKGFDDDKVKLHIKIPVYILFLGLMFLGIRGRIQQKTTIRVGTAYFSDNAFLNQLGLNPVFTLIRSYLDSLNESNGNLSIMDDKEAIKNVQQWLHIDSTKYNSPIAREIIPDTISSKKQNVIIIIMESMSAAKMGKYGNDKNLTPFLDSLSKKSLSFNNVYTAGIHTFNGIFSTLFSFPALYRQHTMDVISLYDGIGSTLKKQDYSATFFTTHDAQFDNVEGFLNANMYDNIISQANYPISEVKTTLGVPDDYMFRHSIPVINELNSTGKPFLAAFMTSSDHGPYYIPKYFTPKSKKIKNQIVEYADWSLMQFIEMAKTCDWYDNTIFVFIADHGAPINVKNDIPLNYFHTPLIIYKSENSTAKEYNQIGSQIDVFPTVMGLLKLPYINNTLGIDLLKEKRPYALLNFDDKVGVIDNKHLWIMNSDKNKDILIKYKISIIDSMPNIIKFITEKESSAINIFNIKLDSVSNNQPLIYKPRVYVGNTPIFESLPDKISNMEGFAKSNMQTYQYMLNNSLLKVE